MDKVMIDMTKEVTHIMEWVNRKGVRICEEIPDAIDFPGAPDLSNMSPPERARASLDWYTGFNTLPGSPVEVRKITRTFALVKQDHG